MKKVGSALLLCVLIAGCAKSSFSNSPATVPGASANTSSGQMGASQIVGGRLAQPLDLGVSATVGILLTDDIQLDNKGQIIALSPRRMMCTGVLIAQDTVLTAAHCEVAQFRYQFIIFSRDSQNWTQDLIRQVWQVAQEPTWVQAQSGQILSNQAVDLALMKFRGTVPAGYAPAAIFQSPQVAVGTGLMVFGYGETNLGANDAGLLRTTLLPMITPVTQTESFNIGGTSVSTPPTRMLRNDQFTLPSLQSGICLGDSGGPVFLITGGQYTLVGITSSTYGTDNPNDAIAQCHTFSIHTYVYPHQGWIAQTVAQMRADPRVGAIDPSAAGGN